MTQPWPDRVDVDVGGHVVALSTLGKVLWPAAGFTKGGMIEYYRAIAPVLLPHLEGRPLTLARYPDGVDQDGWYQTRCPHPPPWIRTCPVPSPSGRGDGRDYCLVNETAALLWAVNLDAIELHPLLARTEDLEQPTAVVFDLDPGWASGLVACCRLALRIRALLGDMGLSARAKTSGWNGLHVFAPVKEATYRQTKGLARAVAKVLASEIPELAVDRSALELRTERVFVDWSQNDFSKSIVAPYSLRARPYPTVSMPLHWQEVEDAVSRSDASELYFAPEEASARVERYGDLFLSVLGPGANVPDGAVQALVGPLRR